MHSVLNVKAVVAAFNQEKALVGAFSVLMNLRMELFQALACCLEAAEDDLHERGPVHDVLRQVAADAGLLAPHEDHLVVRRVPLGAGCRDAPYHREFEVLAVQILTVSPGWAVNDY